MCARVCVCLGLLTTRGLGVDGGCVRIILSILLYVVCIDINILYEYVCIIYYILFCVFYII